jgi:hypothetical protein
MSQAKIEVFHYKKMDTQCGNIISDIVEIVNTGNNTLIISKMEFKGESNSLFTWKSKFPLKIAPSQSELVCFDYMPETPGKKQLILEVENNSINEPMCEVNIEYNVRIQKIQVIDTIKMEYIRELKNADVCFEVKNLGDTSASYQIISRDPYIAVNTPLINIPWGAFKTPCISVSPFFDKQGDYKTHIILKNVKCGFEFSVPVLVKYSRIDSLLDSSRFSKAILVCDTVVGSPGKVVDVYFKLKIKESDKHYYSGFLHTAISYNSSVLNLIKDEKTHFYQETDVKTQQGVIKTIKIEFPRSIFTTPYKISFKVGLGTKEIEPIYLDSLQTSTEEIFTQNIITTVNGAIINKICNEAGPRLVNITENSGLKKISPNPVGINAQLNYSIVEEGYTSICAYDINGVKVADLYSGMPTQGDYTIDWNTYNLGSGMYIIVMTTPTQTYRQNVSIYK